MPKPFQVNHVKLDGLDARERDALDILRGQHAEIRQVKLEKTAQ
jgi:hypothetical protein